MAHLFGRMDQRNFRASKLFAIRTYYYTTRGCKYFFGAGVETISRTQVLMKEVCWISVTAKNELHFNEYRQFVGAQFPYFLTLATGLPNYPT